MAVTDKRRQLDSPSYETVTDYSGFRIQRTQGWHKPGRGVPFWDCLREGPRGQAYRDVFTACPRKAHSAPAPGSKPHSSGLYQAPKVLLADKSSFASKLVPTVLGVLALLFAVAANAAVLPEERADTMYHSYSGGGVTIDGPSVLVRKNIGESVSVSANYYVDMISGASIDVQSTASAYSEQRDEYSIAADYLVDKTTMSLGYTNSSENDYEAETVAFGISQGFFGDMSTLDLRVSYGSDDVYRNGDDTFADVAEHRRYGVSWNQILTRKLIAELSVETVSDEGYLNNPYRSVRFVDPSTDLGFGYQREFYPRTRNSDAVAIRAKYRLPYRAAVKSEYRRYADSWGIEADNIELRYTHPLNEGDQWILEGKLRFYKQSGADFYSDLFPYVNASNFRARDKELSDYSNTSIGFGVSYRLPDRWSLFDRKNTVNLFWDYMYFDYDNFRDVRVHGDGDDIAVGEEPAYSFGANVIRLYWSVWL